MEKYKINETTLLEFTDIGYCNFSPVLLQDNKSYAIPLIVTSKEIPHIKEKLDIIDFCGLPIHYVEMIVAGCISIILKNSNKL